MSPRLGFHNSLNRDLLNLINQHLKIGSETVQIFLGSPQSLNVSELVPGSLRERVKNHMFENNFTLYVHSPYVLNYGKVQNEKYVKYMEDVQKQIGDLPAGVVVHMGKAGVDLRYTDQQKAENLAWYMQSNRRDLNVPVLLENAAGQGSEYGTTIEHIRKVFELTDNSEGLYVCIDTQHSYASGLCDFSGTENIQKLFEQFDSMLPERLQLIHLNDSKTLWHSRVDRHENIGSGYIWSQGLGSLTTLYELADSHSVDICLETPEAAKDFIDLRSK